MSASVVVIGAGPGGLAAAILLANAGLRVKVIERLSVVGGRTSAISAGGFKFDLGPTFFLFPRVLEEIFAAAGASLRSEVEMVRLDPQYRIVFGEGGELDATAEVSQMEAQIAQLSLEDAGGFRRFLDENRVKLRRMQPCLESPFLGWRDIFNVRLLKMLPMLRPHQSIDTYLKRFFRDPRIRLAFSFQSKYLGIATLLLFGGQVLPILSLVAASLNGSAFQLALSLAGTGAALLPRVLGVFRFRQPLDGALLHPIGICALLAIQWFAFFRLMARRPAIWKGREYFRAAAR